MRSIAADKSRRRSRTGHALKRARERYGHKIRPMDIMRKIDSGDFKEVRRLSASRALCVATLDEHDVYFVYSGTHGKPLTILPDHIDPTADVV